MSTERIRTTHAYGEVYPNVFDDFAWAKEHEKELLEEYGRCTILIYERKVIGVGSTQLEAVEDAENRLPDDFEGTLTPITYRLVHRQPFFRVRPKVDQ